MNILVAVDANSESDLKEAREMAALALERYIGARTRIAELEALIELRRGMGATVRAAASSDAPLSSTPITLTYVCPNCGTCHDTTACPPVSIPTNAPHWPAAVVAYPDPTQVRIADALERIANALELLADAPRGSLGI